MNKNLMAQSHLDKICYKRIQSPDFTHPTIKIKLIALFKSFGGAKLETSFTNIPKITIVLLMKPAPP